MRASARPSTSTVPTRRLGDLVAQPDGLADGPFGSKLKTEHYAASGARVIRLQNIGRGSFLDANRAFVSLEHFVTLRRHEAVAGDVVVASLGDGARPAGRACIVPDGLGPAVVKADCFRVRPNPTLLRSAFLVGYLNSPIAQEAFVRLMRGSTRPRVTLKMLGDLRIPAPPLAVQDSLVGQLEKAHTELERAQAALFSQCAAAELLPESLLRAAFSGVTPISASLAGDAVPSGWRWETLTSVARLESGHTPSRRHPEWWGGDVPWIALPDIRALDGKLAYETTERTNELGLTNSSARMLPTHTVVMCRDASVGYVTIMGRPMATSQHFVNWVCGSDLDPFFLAYAIRASRSYIRGLSSGSVLQTIYMPTLRSLQVCMPSIEAQRRIVAELDARLAEADRLRAALADRRGQVEKLPSGILRAAFTPGGDAPAMPAGAAPDVLPELVHA